MGYSIYVVTKREELARRMDKYLRSAVNDKWMPNARIATNFEPSSSSLSYAHLGKDRFQVGFDYSCMGQVENPFVWDIVKWMAGVMGLTRLCYDGCEYFKLKEMVKSSLDNAYKMPHISRSKAALIRAAIGPTRREITKAKRRLQQIKDGWVLYTSKYNKEKEL